MHVKAEDMHNAVATLSVAYGQAIAGKQAELERVQQQVAQLKEALVHNARVITDLQGKLENRDNTIAELVKEAAK